MDIIQIAAAVDRIATEHGATDSESAAICGAVVRVALTGAVTLADCEELARGLAMSICAAG